MMEKKFKIEGEYQYPQIFASIPTHNHCFDHKCNNF
jgi:hypothetical protein